ncbi:uncharacterized protein LOC141901220 [Tubulanus polymorphus]|uniref:uncharacterized protein LOC141901220 n=1 Tax=Tubulanus polymorphus TaxID=672921 RepID=UPI003DA2D90E
MGNLSSKKDRRRDKSLKFGIKSRRGRFKVGHESKYNFNYEKLDEYDFIEVQYESRIVTEEGHPENDLLDTALEVVVDEAPPVALNDLDVISTAEPNSKSYIERYLKTDVSADEVKAELDTSQARGDCLPTLSDCLNGLDSGVSFVNLDDSGHSSFKSFSDTDFDVFDADDSAVWSTSPLSNFGGSDSPSRNGNDDTVDDDEDNPVEFMDPISDSDLQSIPEENTEDDVYIANEEDFKSDQYLDKINKCKISENIKSIARHQTSRFFGLKHSSCSMLVRDIPFFRNELTEQNLWWKNVYPDGTVVRVEMTTPKLHLKTKNRRSFHSKYSNFQNELVMNCHHSNHEGQPVGQVNFQIEGHAEPLQSRKKTREITIDIESETKGRGPLEPSYSFTHDVEDHCGSFSLGWHEQPGEQCTRHFIDDHENDGEIDQCPSEQQFFTQVCRSYAKPNIGTCICPSQYACVYHSKEGMYGCMFITNIVQKEKEYAEGVNLGPDTPIEEFLPIHNPTPEK